MEEAPQAVHVALCLAASVSTRENKGGLRQKRRRRPGSNAAKPGHGWNLQPRDGAQACDSGTARAGLQT